MNELSILQMEEIQGGDVTPLFSCWAAGTLGLIGIAAIATGWGAGFAIGAYSFASGYLASCIGG